ncbi:unnamed protein product, partial [Iphiclides podalirius]
MNNSAGGGPVPRDCFPPRVAGFRGRSATGSGSLAHLTCRGSGQVGHVARWRDKGNYSYARYRSAIAAVVAEGSRRPWTPPGRRVHSA